MTLGSIDGNRLPKTEKPPSPACRCFRGPGNGSKLIGSARTDAVIDHGTAAVLAADRSLSLPWSDAGVTTNATDFRPPQDALNADWELVTSRRPIPPGKTTGFGRVAVTPGDGFAGQAE